jgi:photosystem II stability/assembly factor-like uncharacterized protein
MYKSTDAGRTWEHIGLLEAGQIGRVAVHPKDPDLLYVAVLGHIFGSNPERGVYRSQDGGDSWEKVLFVSDKTGAVDITMDATNPRILYAGMWTAERKPWTTVSGSEEGGIWKTTNGGDDWEKLAGGLPDDLVGKIGVSVSGANPDRVWAIIEANKNGGVYRSDNAGKTWRKINEEARLRQRPWYYNHIYADPQDENVVYILNTGMYKSTDGGRSYSRIGTPHGDNHDLWINPADNQAMIEANDGGANVSLNGGQSWSTQRNQPTAEIYRLTVDEQYPYRVYGAQQDNSTISVPSRAGRGVVEDWYEVGGCESGHIAVKDPTDPHVIYAGCYGGNISRVDRKTGQSRSILVYPQLQLGQAPKDLKYRFQWNAPIRISPHNPNFLYHTSQVVHLSKDEGQSWEAISPDLSRNEESRQGYAGGPISHDSTGVEVYGVVFAFEESPHQAGLLWAGSDDGLVHVSKNGGKDWNNITPPDMPEWGTVNMIDLSAHDPGRAFLAVQKYREDDFRPYVFRTNDLGESWELLTDGNNGIPENHFVRVVREDPKRKGLLFAGTEFGLYASFDDGEHWQSLQLNLPVTPVTDLAVHRDDLVVSTQGRAFWVLDDITPLQQVNAYVAEAAHYLYEPQAAYRSNFGSARIRYFLAEKPEGETVLEVLDSKDEVVATFKGKGGDSSSGEDASPASFFGGGAPKLPVNKGLNHFTWNLRQERIDIPKGVVVWGGRGGGKLMPGSYSVRLKSGEWSQTQPLEVALDPRSSASLEDLQEQSKLLSEIRNEIDDLYKALTLIRDVRSQMKAMGQWLEKAERQDDEIKEASKALLEKFKGVEEQLTQTKSKSNQDPLNYPPMLDNQTLTLYDYVAGSDYRPTSGAYERLEDLQNQLRPVLKSMDGIVDKDLADFSKMLKKKNIGAIIVPE